MALKKSRSYCIELTPKKVLYILFGRKVCPSCGGRMKGEFVHESVDPVDFESDLKATGLTSDPYVDLCYLEYHCKKCGYVCRLSELVDFTQ